MPNHIQNWIFITENDNHAVDVGEVIKGFTRKEGDETIVDFENDRPYARRIKTHCLPC